MQERGTQAPERALRSQLEQDAGGLGAQGGQRDGVHDPSFMGAVPDGSPAGPVPLVALQEPPEPQRELEFRPELMEALLESHFAGIVVYDMWGRTLWASSHVCTLTGWTLEERAGRPGIEIIHPDDVAEASRLYLYALQEPGRSVSFEQRIVRKDGRVIWVEAHIKNLLGVPHVNAVVSNYHDITERKNAYEALEASEQRQRQLAHRDHLTNLPNRRSITAALQRASEELASGVINGFAFFFVDLDGFKKINDRLGHAFGDAYLQTTAERLTQALDEGDVVARIGGDEFAVLARTADTRGKAELLAHRLVHTMSDPVRIQGHLVQLPACVGLVTARPGWEPADFLRHADAALYAAKQEGTGRVRVFDEGLQAYLHEQTVLAEELSVAICEGQLDVLYQPIVRLDTREVVGLEALVCWHHPTRGLLRAGSFIQTAEETGLVIPLGEWVFERVCRDAARWHAELGDRAPWVSCNLSAAQLIRQDFADVVRQTVQTYGLPAGLVRFELTERGLFETEGPWRDRLWEAEAAGVKLLLDDFGSGYTSMRYLAEFPISVLKLDREYVHRSTSSDPDRRARALSLIRAVGRMSASLDMLVVAEGVETAEQHQAVTEAGCHLGQGWLYEHALTLDAVEQRLRDAWRLAPGA